MQPKVLIRATVFDGAIVQHWTFRVNVVTDRLSRNKPELRTPLALAVAICAA